MLLKQLFIISLILILSGCARPPDVWVCTRLNASQGYCTKTLSSDTFTVDDDNLLNGKTWLDIEIDSIYVPTESWVQIKSYIIKMCKINKNCGSGVGDWPSRLDAIDKMRE